MKPIKYDVILFSVNFTLTLTRELAQTRNALEFMTAVGKNQQNCLGNTLFAYVFCCKMLLNNKTPY